VSGRTALLYFNFRRSPHHVIHARKRRYPTSREQLRWQGKGDALECRQGAYNWIGLTQLLYSTLNG
jgi:hypothetical protein